MKKLVVFLQIIANALQLGMFSEGFFVETRTRFFRLLLC